MIEKLNDCTTTRVDIAAAPELQAEHKITGPYNRCVQQRRGSGSLPGEYYDDNEASKSDVQNAIDEIIMSDF